LLRKILEKKWHFWRNFWLFLLKNAIFEENLRIITNLQ
jgi:hypothetical protein